MSTKKEALPNIRAESGRVSDEDQKAGCEQTGADTTEEKDADSVAPPLPTSPESEPRRSGAV